MPRVEARNIQGTFSACTDELWKWGKIWFKDLIIFEMKDAGANQNRKKKSFETEQT